MAHERPMRTPSRELPWHLLCASLGCAELNCWAVANFGQTTFGQIQVWPIATILGQKCLESVFNVSSQFQCLANVGITQTPAAPKPNTPPPQGPRPKTARQRPVQANVLGQRADGGWGPELWSSEGRRPCERAMPQLKFSNFKFKIQKKMPKRG